MNILIVFLLAFLLIRFAVVLLNVFSRHQLPAVQEHGNDLVSVLIPARNEASTIANLLSDLCTQSYGALEILVYDDDSTDPTAAIVQSYMAANDNVKLLKGKGLPTSWLGKNHACHHLAKQARGQYLLFIDADVRLSPGAIENAVAFLKTNNLDLLSLFPVQSLPTTGERLVVPLMNWILLMFLPLVLIRKSKRPSLSAANGQFMFFQATAYHRHQFHERLKASPVEDIHIIRMMKSLGLAVDTRLSGGQVHCRMYTGYREALNGFVKNVAAFFGGNKLLMIVFALLSTFGFLPFVLARSWFLLLVYLFLALVIRVLVAVQSRQSVLFNIILCIPQQISFFIVCILALTSGFRRNYKWKGRTLSEI